MIDPRRDLQWYERRKRRIVRAVLGRERYRSAFEPACGTGALTAELAPRCMSLLAIDAHGTSVARAVQRTRRFNHVRCLEATLPDGWPEGSFDLIVLSEWLYYVDDAQRACVASLVRESMSPDADIVACHWRHPIPESTVTAEMIHVELGKRLGCAQRAIVDDEDFLLHCWRAAGASVAEEQGLR